MLSLGMQRYWGFTNINSFCPFLKCSKNLQFNGTNNPWMFVCLCWPFPFALVNSVFFCIWSKFRCFLQFSESHYNGKILSLFLIDLLIKYSCCYSYHYLLAEPLNSFLEFREPFSNSVLLFWIQPFTFKQGNWNLIWFV